MATEEPQTDEDINPPPNPAPAIDSSAPAAAPTMPSYPEMIISAIEALNDKNGSNKSSISRHIESTYGNLPPVHSTLITHHLNRMKATGQLVVFKNNYLKPDPDAPPRRGRGRPPKPKIALSQGTVLTPPRSRGRPPKTRDPFAPVSSRKKNIASSPSGSVRKRGRPPKFPKVGPTQGSTAPGGGAPAGPPRGRGRPPKMKPAVAASVGA